MGLRLGGIGVPEAQNEGESVHCKLAGMELLSVCMFSASAFRFMCGSSVPSILGSTSTILP